MSEYIKISDVIKICKSLYRSYGTTAFFNVPVFVDLLRTVAVDTPEEDLLVCALEETKRLNMDLAVRCDNDNVRACDVNKSFLICELIESAMGKESEETVG